MFFGDWKKVPQDEAIVYTDFDVHAFRIVMAFVIVKTEERQAIVTALSDFHSAHVQEVIKVAGFFNETLLEAIGLQIVQQPHETLNKLDFDPREEERWKS